jgi:hypothetical protein
MKKISIFFIAFLLIGSFNSQAQKLKKIFNGKNLDGWVIPQPNNDNWTVANKILTVTSDDTRKGKTLWTEKSYKNFIIQADYKNVSGIVDSGFFLRSEKDQVQIGISGSLKRDLTGSPYIPGKGYPKEADLSSLKKDDWNTMKIKVEGNSYTVWLNGVEVMNYTSEGMINEGPIGIQLHPGNVMSIQYKNIVLAEI